MSSLQKKETLLIVDDSKFQRVVIRQSLGEHFNFAEAVPDRSNKLTVTSEATSLYAERLTSDRSNKLPFF